MKPLNEVRKKIYCNSGKIIIIITHGLRADRVAPFAGEKFGLPYDMGSPLCAPIQAPPLFPLRLYIL